MKIVIYKMAHIFAQNYVIHATVPVQRATPDKDGYGSVIESEALLLLLLYPSSHNSPFPKLVKT